MTRELLAVFGWFVDSIHRPNTSTAAPLTYRWRPAIHIRDGRTACTLMDFSYN